jgi:hypothetical protein
LTDQAKARLVGYDRLVFTQLIQQIIRNGNKNFHRRPSNDQVLDGKPLIGKPGRQFWSIVCRRQMTEACVKNGNPVQALQTSAVWPDGREFRQISLN